MPIRSRLGYAEFQCITLQETQGTKEPLSKMMDIGLTMTAEHDYGLLQQEVGRAPASTT